MIIKKWYLVILILLLTVFVASCESESVEQIGVDNIEKAEEIKLDFSNFSLNFNLGDNDGLFSMTYDLNENTLDDVFDIVIEELFSLSLEDDEAYGFRSIYNKEKNSITITPLIKNLVEDENTTYSNEECGSGEGWVYYESCRTESCARKAMEASIEEVKDHLVTGTCIDTRLKRYPFKVVICARTVDC